MVVALMYVAISVLVLALLTFVYVIEDMKGERVFLLSARTKLDGFFVWVIKRIESMMFAFTNGIVRLLLHYGANSVLKRVLAVIRNLEQKVEDLVRRNRTIAKNIGTLRTNSQSTETSDHKDNSSSRDVTKT